MIWFCSDTHFGHRNIIRYAGRPFQTVEEMDETLIINWNSRVKPTDEVWHLGDIFFHNPTTTTKLMNRLNGKIHLIRGNHDDLKKIALYPKKIVSVQDYKELSFRNKKYVLFHYPIASWNKKYRGSAHLYGHIHEKTVDVGVNGFNMCVEHHNYFPVSIIEVESWIQEIRL